MVKYLTQEWLDLGKFAVNNNEKFREIAKGLNLVIYHIITQVPPKNETIDFWSTFKDGECVEVKLGEKVDVNFTLTAPYSIWKQIHDGTVEILQMILEKKLMVEGKLIKGIKIMKLAPLMNKVIASIDTEFLD